MSPRALTTTTDTGGQPRNSPLTVVTPAQLATHDGDITRNSPFLRASWAPSTLIVPEVVVIMRPARVPAWQLASWAPRAGLR